MPWSTSGSLVLLQTSALTCRALAGGQQHTVVDVAPQSWRLDGWSMAVGGLSDAGQSLPVLPGDKLAHTGSG